MYDNYLFLGHGNTMQASEAFVQQQASVSPRSYFIETINL
jgi:hypothetical protein